jgi:hypothetical protein
MFVFVISSRFIAKVTLCAGHKHYVAHPPSAEFPKVFFFCFTAAEREARGGVVAEALRYKPEGRGFDSRWCHWIFSFT